PGIKCINSAGSMGDETISCTQVHHLRCQEAAAKHRISNLVPDHCIFRDTSIFTMNNKTLARIGFLLLLALVATVALRAQTPTPAQTNVLRPPAGAKVALIEFADLQCPDCARAYPLLEEAVKAYKIPLVVYDFPLPMHPWAQDASVF